MMLNPLQPINAAVSSLDYGIICTQTLDKLHEVQFFYAKSQKQLQ